MARDARVLGPHADAALARLAETRWLAPDSELVRVTAEALGWLRDRIDEHLAALAPFAPQPAVFERLALARVEVTRSMRAAFAQHDRGWTRARGATHAGAVQWLEATHAAAAD